MTYLGSLVRFLAVGVFLVTLGGAHRALAGDMFQDLITAWNAHDPNKVAAMFTSDGLYEDVALGMKSRGTEEIRKFAKFTFDAVPDMKMELVNSFSSGGHGYAEWVLSGTDVGVFKTGKAFSFRGVSISDIADGKFARNLDYYDLSIVMKQEGILPAATAQADKPPH